APKRSSRARSSAGEQVERRARRSCSGASGGADRQPEWPARHGRAQFALDEAGAKRHFQKNEHQPNQAASDDMQVMILAGGFGTRISEESAIRPKPMVEIGGRPILWHIMKMYLAHGLSDFVICCGYKGHMIKEYFRDYALGSADVTFDMREHTTTLHKTSTEPWKVTLVDPGLDTMTGGRIKRAARYLDDGPFCCTYGDGVGDVDVTRLIAFHEAQKTLATVTAVQPPGRFGAFTLRADQVKVPTFKEKPEGDGAWVN